jgi:hypothetical protein
MPPIQEKDIPSEANFVVCVLDCFFGSGFAAFAG